MEGQADRARDVEELRRRIARLETAPRRGDATTVPSGSAALDSLLPEGGFRRGTLVEWLSAGEGAGGGTLAFLAAREACRRGGALVVLDRRGEFFPPAAVRLGIELEQLLVVRVENAADHDWAMDQALRSPAVAAVLAWPEKLDDRTFRRWQLAIEQGGGLGLLLRTAAARAEPSWADVRLLIEPLATTKPRPMVAPPRYVAPQRYGATTSRGFMARQLKISVLRCRGGNGGRSMEVELDEETYRMRPLAGTRLPSGDCLVRSS